MSTAAKTVSGAAAKRGAFIVLEGVDRCGKSTQCQLLVEKMKDSLPCVGMRFPDRTTHIGKLLSAYLQNAEELDDQAVHLLFSSNRWEARKTIMDHLEAGRTIICDRYAYSGVAFTAAKGLDIDWCRAPDHGLPAPDAVLFLSLSPEAAEKRGGFGEERYEKAEFQAKVRKVYDQLKDDTFEVIDADATIDELNARLQKRIADIAERSATQPVKTLQWMK